MSPDRTPHHADFQRYRKDWDTNARIDAKWSVLTLADKFGERWDDHEFFGVGIREADEIFRYLESLGLGTQAAAAARCLDFGCGVGRLTQALASRFPDVVGIDISESMLLRARAYARTFGKENIRFVQSTSSNLAEDLGRQDFGFIYSNITLQHLNNDLQREYIRRFSEILAPRGLAVFQIPSVRPHPTIAAKILATARAMTPTNMMRLLYKAIGQGALPWRIRMELNVLSELEVEKVARQAGLTLKGKGYVDWDVFYRTQEFVLESSAPQTQGRYPISPVYFFQKEP